jgi:cation transport ATPase
MIVQIGRLASLVLSIVSLYMLLGSAFFVPGSRWQERLLVATARLAVAGCVCFVSGLLFEKTEFGERLPGEKQLRLTRTLPVRLFFWAAGLMAVLFAVSSYLEEYYVPMLLRHQPR